MLCTVQENAEVILCLRQEAIIVKKRNMEGFGT